MNKLNSLALGYAGAILSALGILLTGILGKMGLYTSFVSQMEEMHMFFSLSVSGIITGMIESAVLGFVLFWLFGLLYNIFAKK